MDSKFVLKYIENQLTPLEAAAEDGAKKRKTVDPALLFVLISRQIRVGP